MLSKLLPLCLLACYLMFVPVTAQAGITNFSKFVTAGYWQTNNKNGNDVIMDKSQVADFNRKICSVSPTVVDLASYPKTVSGASIKAKISNYEVLNDDLYLHGNRVSDNYKNIIRTQTNVDAIPSEIKVQYAVTVRRCNLRNLPTGEGLFYFPSDQDFDALQETTLDPAEPVAVLHSSANGYFYYVQTVNYIGWVSKYDIAFTDKNTWMQYVSPKHFLVVTGKNITVKTSGEMVEYQQGSRLPLEGEQSDTYLAAAPVRGKNGKLSKVRVLVKKNPASMNVGYLPYTSNNLIAAAFKFYDTPYGWGGLKSGVDCSSLIYNVYRTVGIYLPRNADEQETSAGIHYSFSGLGSERRDEIIKNLKPGACLFMDGHVAMYLGQSGDMPYIIHSLGSYYEGGQRHRPMKVVVSDLNLNRSSGLSFLESFTNAVEFK